MKQEASEQAGTLKKSALSCPKQALVDLMQQLRFGRIEGLEVRDSEPVMEPLPIVSKVVLFGKKPVATPCHAPDFALKQSVAELFSTFERERSFTVKELVVDDGLPVRMVITRTR